MLKMQIPGVTVGSESVCVGIQNRNLSEAPQMVGVSRNADWWCPNPLVFLWLAKGRGSDDSL